MNRRAALQARWYVLLLAVVLALAPTVSRLVNAWPPAMVVCHADSGTTTLPDPGGAHRSPLTGDACALCHVGWAPPPSLHHLPVLAGAPMHGQLPDWGSAPPSAHWTPQSPRAPPTAMV